MTRRTRRQLVGKQEDFLRSVRERGLAALQLALRIEWRTLPKPIRSRDAA